jgi:hypothetical protein
VALAAVSPVAALIVLASLLVFRSDRSPGPVQPSATARSAGTNAPADSVLARIDPSDYDVAESRWQTYGPLYETDGSLDRRFGVTHAHVYGSAAGATTYRFSLTAAPAGRVQLTARLSAEAPSTYHDPRGRLSDVTLVVNERALRVRRVGSDDGHGTHYTWRFDARMLGAGENRIEFRVAPDAVMANGLCIYGAAIAPGYQDESITIQTDS